MYKIHTLQRKRKEFVVLDLCPGPEKHTNSITLQRQLELSSKQNEEITDLK